MSWRIITVICLLLFSTAFSGHLVAQERPRIGLVLSGGGARGIAHIGVLKVLEELRIPIDAIAATSMGAVVGGSYAAGVSPTEMEKIVTTLDWVDLFKDNPSRQFLSNRRKLDEYRSLSSFSVGLRGGKVLFPQGFISGQKVELFLKQLTNSVENIDNFDQLPIPFRAVATDLVSGKVVEFGSGQLNKAMRSSMSIPGFIAPTAIGEGLYVDGGLVRNLPIDTVRKMNIDVIIAVNLGTTLLQRDALNSALGVTAQMLLILTEQNVQASLAQLTDKDILISPELGDISSSNFTKASEAIVAGEIATRDMADSLRRFSLSASHYQMWQQRMRQFKPVSAPEIIDAIRISPMKHVNPERILALMETKTGQPLNTQTLENDIKRIYGTGDFELINYSISQDDGKNVLTVEANEKSWGPNYLRFGVNLSSDFQSNPRINIFANYNRTWVNDRGAEWQTDVQLGTTSRIRTELYQPFAADSPWFISPYFNYVDDRIDIFDDDRAFAEYSLTEAALGVDLGYDLGPKGELRVGFQYGPRDAKASIGDPELPQLSVTQGAVTGRYIYDQLDNLNFPKSGQGFFTDLYYTNTAVGADSDYGKLLLNWQSAHNRGKNTLVAGAKFGSRLGNDEIPIYDEFSLGGFLQLSGYQTRQLRGQFMGLGRLVFYREMGQIAGNFGGKLYAGGSLETGNVWDSTDEIDLSNLRFSSSIFLGADTPLGPFYLGYGVTDTGENSAYLFIGRP